MKKILIALVAVAAAAAAHAATINWITTPLYSATSATDGTKSTTAAASAVMYAFVLDSTAYNTLKAMDYATMSSTVWSDFGSSIGDSTKAAVATANGNITWGEQFSQTPGTVYRAFIITDKVGDQEFYIANVASGTNNGTATVLGSSNLGTQWVSTTAGKSSAIGAWTATASVPEPTSGLLMLLGFAGLALRRKRA